MYAGIVDSDSDSGSSDNCDGKTIATARDLCKSNLNPFKENICTGKFKQVECKYAENIQQLSFANSKGNEDSLIAGHAAKPQINCLDNLKRYAADNFKLHSKDQSKANPTQDLGHAFCTSENEATKAGNQDVLQQPFHLATIGNSTSDRKMFVGSDDLPKTTSEKDYKMKIAVGRQNPPSFQNARSSATASKVPEKPSLATLINCSGDVESSDIFIEQTCTHFPPSQIYLNEEDISIVLEEAQQQPYPKLTNATDPTEKDNDDCVEQSICEFAKDQGSSADQRKRKTSYSCVGQTFKHSSQKRRPSENTSKMTHTHVCTKPKSQQYFPNENLAEETRRDRGVSFAKSTEVKHFPPDHKAHEVGSNRTDMSCLKHGPMKQSTEKPKLEIKSAVCPGELGHIDEFVSRRGVSTSTAANLSSCLTTSKVSNGLYEVSGTPELTEHYRDVWSSETCYANEANDQVEIWPTVPRSKLELDRPPMNLGESAINNRQGNQRSSPYVSISIPTTSGNIANISVSITDDNRSMIRPHHASNTGAFSPGFILNNLSRSDSGHCERKQTSQTQTCNSLKDQGIPYVNTASSLRECPRFQWLDGLYFPPNLWQTSSEETIIPDPGTTRTQNVKGNERQTCCECCKSPSVRRNHHSELPLHRKVDVSEFTRRQTSDETHSEGNIEGSENETEKASQNPTYMIGSLDLLETKTVEESMLIFMLYKKYKRVKNFINRKTKGKLTILNYRVNFVWHAIRNLVSSKSKGFKKFAKKYDVCGNFCSRFVRG